MSGDFTLVGSNIEVTIDGATGGIKRLANAVTGQVLCDLDSGLRPVAIQQRNHLQAAGARGRRPNNVLYQYEIGPVDVETKEDGSVVARWSVEAGAEIIVSYRIDERGDLAITSDFHGDTALPPEGLRSPIIGKPLSLNDDGGADLLMFPSHSGWLVPDPLSHVHEGRYPEGWQGCSVQLMAYYTPGQGGFSFAAHDPHGTGKVLHFSGEEISFTHLAWDVRKGAGLRTGYPVVISALTRGDWYESVDRYRDWALAEAPWASRGPVASRSLEETPRWVYEEVGINIWGAPSSVDWSTWIGHYADAVGTPLHITPGWDWPATRPHQVGEEGWFPARFHPANVEAWQGHRVTPYLNDIFVSVRAPDFMERWEPNLVQPYEIFPFTRFSEPPVTHGEPDVRMHDRNATADVAFFVCPATEEQRQFHTWRNMELMTGHGLDGVYYDISSGVGLAMRCLRPLHGHHPGHARGIARAYDELNRLTLEAGIERLGSAPAQGTELIAEPFMAHVDFYQARACSGPAGALEADVPAPEDPPGTGRELIPLFQAIYHDYGPVHHDGWLQLSRETGDIFYWVAARIVVQWGGLLSLQYAINRPERFADDDPAVTFIGWDAGEYTFDDLPELDKAKAGFAAELAAARTGFATPYLAYGRMLRPAPMTGMTSIEVDYRLEYDSVIPGGFRDGTWTVPGVLQGAWAAPDGRVGVVLANLGSEEVSVGLWGSTNELWGLNGSAAQIRSITMSSVSEVGVCETDGFFEIDVSVGGRRVVVVEIDTWSA